MSSASANPIDSLKEEDILTENEESASSMADASVSPAEDEGQSLEERLEEYKREKEELHDRLLRKQAEFENFRRRSEKEKQGTAHIVRSMVIREFLPVMDACERALKTFSDTENLTPESDPFRSGIELIYKQFLDTLSRFKVFPISAVGHPFDPNLHHAILRDETTDYPENQVIEDLLTGYTFEDRLLRPAQVKVAIAPSNS